MKIVFFGLGSIGSKHASLIKKLRKDELYAYRTYKGQKKVDVRDIKELNGWAEIDRIKPDVAFITNPTSMHIDTAIKCAERGMNLFIEKSLDSQTKNLDRLLRIISKKKIKTYVAYVLRFHPVINEIRKYVKKNKFLHMRIQTTSYLHRWRPYSDPSKSYSSYLKMGGGVIYDLSHELDYVQYILGDIKSIKGQFGKRGSVTVDAEDYADILVQTKKGPVNIHIDFLSQIEQRIIQVDFEERSIQGDIINNKICEFKNGKQVKCRKLKGNLKKCYEDQLKYFFKNIKNSRMMNNIFEAAVLFRKIYSFKRGK